MNEDYLIKSILELDADENEMPEINKTELLSRILKEMDKHPA